MPAKTDEFDQKCIDQVLAEIKASGALPEPCAAGRKIIEARTVSPSIYQHACGCRACDRYLTHLHYGERA